MLCKNYKKKLEENDKFIHKSQSCRKDWFFLYKKTKL